ncbi:shematrin-like protein 1 [Orussus abietinus]|uniref:shematrin-like protein 1 n=1 Tax=Orussus abietinus TaxID=222816 RepID=UPI000626991A|nr:shematrin-like protein 1 [Orussus abietinus]
MAHFKIFSILLLAAVLSVASARPGGYTGYGHGYSYPVVYSSYSYPSYVYSIGHHGGYGYPSYGYGHGSGLGFYGGYW